MKHIAESELILNKDGSIYHLNLQPEEIARTIITVGDPGRVKEVSKHFDKIELKKQNREFVTHTGRIGKTRLTVISTGIGTDNIDIVLTELDALVNVNLKTREVKKNLTSLNIMRIGTSGALRGDIAVDSFVASEMAIGMDNMMQYYKWRNTPFEKNLLTSFKKEVLQKQTTVTPYTVCGSSELISKLGKGMTKGITVSASGFYGPQGRVVRGKLAITRWVDRLASFEYKAHRITNFEMESSGIYGMSRMLGHHALSFNVIVANRIQKNFSANGHAAVERLIKTVLERIS